MKSMRLRAGQLSMLHFVSKSEAKHQHLPHERNDINRQNAKKYEIEIHGEVYTFTRATDDFTEAKKVLNISRAAMIEEIRLELVEKANKEKYDKEKNSNANNDPNVKQVEVHNDKNNEKDKNQERGNDSDKDVDLYHRGALRAANDDKHGNDDNSDDIDDSDDSDDLSIRNLNRKRPRRLFEKENNEDDMLIISDGSLLAAEDPNGVSDGEHERLELQGLRKMDKENDNNSNINNMQNDENSNAIALSPAARRRRLNNNKEKRIPRSKSVKKQKQKNMHKNKNKKSPKKDPIMRPMLDEASKKVPLVYFSPRWIKHKDSDWLYVCGDIGFGVCGPCYETYEVEGKSLASQNSWTLPKSLLGLTKSNLGKHSRAAPHKVAVNESASEADKNVWRTTYGVMGKCAIAGNRMPEIFYNMMMCKTVIGRQLHTAQHARKQIVLFGCYIKTETNKTILEREELGAAYDTQHTKGLFKQVMAQHRIEMKGLPFNLFAFVREIAHGDTKSLHECIKAAYDGTDLSYNYDLLTKMQQDFEKKDDNYRGFFEDSDDEDDDDEDEVEMIVKLKELAKLVAMYQEKTKNSLILGYRKYLEILRSLSTDGATAYLLGLQNKIEEDQQKALGESKIVSKTHCSNHELHLLRILDDLKLFNLFDGAKKLIKIIRHLMGTEDFRDALILCIFKSNGKVMLFNKDFDGKWVGVFRDQINKLQEMQLAIFLALIERLDKLADDAKVKIETTKEYEALSLMADHIWDIYTVGEAVNVLAVVNADWQSSTSSVIGAELSLQRGETRLQDMIDKNRLPNKVALITASLRDVDEQWYKVEQNVKRLLRKNDPFDKPSVDDHIYLIRHMLESLNIQTNFKSRHWWQLWTICFDFGQWTESHSLTKDDIVGEVLNGYQTLKRVEKLQRNEMTRGVLITKLFKKCKCLGMRGSNDGYLAEFEKFIEYILSKFELDNVQYDSNMRTDKVYVDIVKVLLNKRDSDHEQVWSDCPRIMKLIRTSQCIMFSSGNLEQTGNVFNVLKGNNQQRMKTLLLDCLAQIKINGPRVGYCEKMIEKVIFLARELGLFSADAPFMQSQLAVCERIVTQTEAKVNKEKLNGKKTSAFDARLRSRALRDEQINGIFKETFCSASEACGFVDKNGKKKQMKENRNDNSNDKNSSDNENNQMELE